MKASVEVEKAVINRARDSIIEKLLTLIAELFDFAVGHIWDLKGVERKCNCQIFSECFEDFFNKSL